MSSRSPASSSFHGEQRDEGCLVMFRFSDDDLVNTRELVNRTWSGPRGRSLVPPDSKKGQVVAEILCRPNLFPPLARQLFKVGISLPFLQDLGARDLNSRPTRAARKSATVKMD